MSARQKRAGTKPFKVCVWGMGRQSVRRPRKISARQKRACTKPFKVCVWGMGRQSGRWPRKTSARCGEVRNEKAQSPDVLAIGSSDKKDFLDKK